MQAICYLNFMKFFKKLKFFCELLKYAKIYSKIFKMRAAARRRQLLNRIFLIVHLQGVHNPRRGLRPTAPLMSIKRLASCNKYI